MQTVAQAVRTKPEWPEPGQPDVRWDLGNQPGTIYWHNLLAGGVASIEGKLTSISFGKHSQHPKSICIGWIPPRKRTRYFRHFDWYEPPHTNSEGYQFRAEPGEGWLAVVKGFHPIDEYQETSYAGISTSIGGRRVNKVMQIEPFNKWLVTQKLELLIDFRQAAIDEGWRPSYPGGGANPPRRPPPELAHWYPELVTR